MVVFKITAEFFIKDKSTSKDTGTPAERPFNEISGVVDAAIRYGMVDVMSQGGIYPRFELQAVKSIKAERMYGIGE